MYTEEQKKAFANAATILDNAGVKYVLMTKDEGENPKSYYITRTDYTNEDAVYYVRFLLNIIYQTAFDILKEQGVKPKKAKVAWARTIMNEVIDRMKNHQNSMKVKKDEQAKQN